MFRKLYVLYSYYNELGDVFSFINSENKEKLIQIEEDMDGTAFINILFLGQSGVGKSTLINLILEEKKSLEGGTGNATTSKNFLVYKKSGVPIRLLDAKGIEKQETVDNYDKILDYLTQMILLVKIQYMLFFIYLNIRRKEQLFIKWNLNYLKNFININFQLFL